MTLPMMPTMLRATSAETMMLSKIDRSPAGNTTRLLGGTNDLRKVGCDLFGAWVAELI